jgi:hypothetical protein
MGTLRNMPGSADPLRPAGRCRCSEVNDARPAANVQAGIFRTARVRQRLARLGAAALVISREAGQSEGTIRAGVGAAGALIGWGTGWFATRA